MKIKKEGWALTLVAAVVIAFVADFELAKRGAAEVRAEVSSHDLAGGLADRLRVGMDRPAAEALIGGYRGVTLFEANGQLTVVYSYWYGFIPPLPEPLRYKVHGKISVTYDGAGRVTDIRTWYA